MILFGVFVVIIIVAFIVFFIIRSDSEPVDLTYEDIRQSAEEGNKIQAIKWYRKLYPVGLAEAKEAVELIERGEYEVPDIPEQD